MKKATVIIKDGNVILNSNVADETQKLDYISFTNWIKDNQDVDELTLKGLLDSDKLFTFEENLFKLKLKRLTLDNINIISNKDINYNINSFVEETLTTVDYNWGSLSILTKIIINSDRTKSFIFDDNRFVFSEDKKSLIHIPNTIKDFVLPEGVEYIGKCLCCDYDKLRSVKFNNSLKEIGDYAFVDTEILTILLPDSVTTIGNGAFCGTDVEKLTLSNNLNKIPDKCFHLNYLEELIIPPSVKEIGNMAFDGMWLKKVTISEGVEIIGYNVFNCLDFISLPASLKEIASDFYYEECVDSEDHPPYIDVHPDNPIFYAKKGTLYYKKDDKHVLDAPFNGTEDDCHKDGDCAHCSHHCPTQEEALKAIEVFRQKAETGDADAEFNLGFVLFYGNKWFEPKYEEGLNWMRKAVAKRYSPALSALADIYHDGRYVAVDYDECFRLLTLAEPDADGRTLNNLATCYEEGVGTTKDINKALQLYKAAKAAGYYKADEDIERLEKIIDKVIQ
ncbi:MAG: leucine-rich repeat protein [Bacteroidales bacterium]|nr:leucine-rich repeat protein [Bacteroidales bacterium]